MDGNCTGCALAYLARNTSTEALEPGDVVAATGIEPALNSAGDLVMQVARATGESEAVVGVVQRRAQLSSHAKEGVAHTSAAEADGAIAPGDYLFIIVHGLTLVKADATAGPIETNQRLTVAAGAGQARAIQTKIIEGLRLSESGPVVGVALAPLKEGQGLIPVLVTLR